MPRREVAFDAKSRKQRVLINALGQTIQLYTLDGGPKKVLLVHGWAGRGTQMFKFAEALFAAGFTVISFDAPAHGRSTGKRTLMPEFIASILQLEKEFGPFDYAIGHSLGGMSLLNAVSRGLKLKKLVAIGSGDVIQDIIDEFVVQLELKKEIGRIMTAEFEKKSSETMHSYSSFVAAQNIRIPVLIVHDQNDREVLVSRAHHISKYLTNGTLLITTGLGHRKILASADIIEKVLAFITGSNTAKNNLS